jgi:hypothetical protein
VPASVTIRSRVDSIDLLRGTATRRPDHPSRVSALTRSAVPAEAASAMAMKQHTRQLHFGKLLRRHGTNARRRGWAYMPRPLQQEPDGVAVALAIHLSLYCAIAACFALVIYFLMQPTRLPNPGMAAHKPSPTTLNYVEALRSEREAAKRNVRLEPEPETTGAATRQVDDEKPETKKPKTQTTSQSRTRPARRQQQQQQPDTTHYAQQPFFGGYRPMY